MKLETILNLATIIVIPIFAVIVGHPLQNRAKKRDDKIAIFRILMTNRIFTWINEIVYALNTIDIVFANDKNVRSLWKAYYDKLCVENPTSAELSKIEIKKNKLLEAMAKSLGYKNKITWETIQNPYIPKGMIDSMLQQQNLQNMYSGLMGKMNNILPTQNDEPKTLLN